jgi:hypothetical protein
MRFGLHLPNFEVGGDPHALADLAAQAEAAGWDGFFLWDHILGDPAWRTPMLDPWIALAAVASATSRLRLGALVTAVPRRRPWQLARETATLDLLSGGRLVVGVGLGNPPGAEFEHFGEDGDARRRARRLDEGLVILNGLWSGEPFGFNGEEYRMRETVFLPTPVQRPRPPIWVAAHWPARAPLRRAARWDGVFPEHADGRRLSPSELGELLEYVRGPRGRRCVRRGRRRTVGRCGRRRARRLRGGGAHVVARGRHAQRRPDRCATANREWTALGLRPRQIRLGVRYGQLPGQIPARSPSTGAEPACHNPCRKRRRSAAATPLVVVPQQPFGIAIFGCRSIEIWRSGPGRGEDLQASG